MRIANKVRLIIIACLSVAVFSVFLATEREGMFILAAVILVPLMMLVPTAVTGGLVCPKCGGGIYTPPDGEVNMNLYYKVILQGKCYHCGESI